MSDYLDHLVAKARNAANAVQPRPASPFEPAAAGPPINGGGPDAEFAPEERFIGETAIDRPLSASTFHPAAEAGRPPIDMRPSTDVAVPLRPSIVNADAARHPIARPGSSTTPAPSPFPVRPTAIVSRPDTSGDAGFGPRPAAHPGSVIMPRSEPARPATVISREQVVSLLRAGPHDGSASTSTRDEAPTIKISIGRVDVRAIMPASPAPRPASARRPSLSLDDYLKRQGERTR